MSAHGLVVADALRDEIQNVRAKVLDQVTKEIKKSTIHVAVPNASIETALEQAVDEALSVDVIDVLAGGWKRWDDLQKTVVESRKDDKPYVIELVDHSIDVDYEPSIEVMMNVLPVTKLDLKFGLSFSLSGFTLTLKRGSVIAVETGTLSSTAKFGTKSMTWWDAQLGRD